MYFDMEGWMNRKNNTRALEKKGKKSQEEWEMRKFIFLCKENHSLSEILNVRLASISNAFNFLLIASHL